MIPASRWLSLPVPDPPDTPCVEWAGWRDAQGYGRSWHEERITTAHRAAWMRKHGPVPAGLVIHHKCMNPGCVRLDHLAPLTSRENILRGTGITAQLARQTRCKRGHPLDAYRERNGQRRCLTCHRARQAAYRARRAARAG